MNKVMLKNGFRIYVHRYTKDYLAHEKHELCETK
jgi:hypothetical protein